MVGVLATLLRSGLVLKVEERLPDRKHHGEWLKPAFEELGAQVEPHCLIVESMSQQGDYADLLGDGKRAEDGSRGSA